MLKYLSGYFSTLSHLNSYCDDVIHMDITKVEVSKNVEILDFLKNRFGSNSFSIEQITLKSEELEKILKRYTERFIVKFAESKNYPFRSLSHKEQIEIIAEEKEILWEVNFPKEIIRFIGELATKSDEIYLIKSENEMDLCGIIEHGLIIRNLERILLFRMAYSD